MVNFINFIKKTSFAGHDLFLGPTQQPVLGCLHSRDLYQVKVAGNHWKTLSGTDSCSELVAFNAEGNLSVFLNKPHEF